MMKRTKVKDTVSGSKDKNPDGKEVNEAARAAIAAAQNEAESIEYARFWEEERQVKDKVE